jgi:hypothetical protein
MTDNGLLAHLIFRNSDGSFTAAGWYWMVLSVAVILGAIILVAFPKIVVKRVGLLRTTPHAVLLLRLFYAAVGAMAIWFALMALTAGPGQLV